MPIREKSNGRKKESTQMLLVRPVDTVLAPKTWPCVTTTGAAGVAGAFVAGMIALKLVAGLFAHEASLEFLSWNTFELEQYELVKPGLLQV
jgi:hypothetical protein